MKHTLTLDKDEAARLMSGEPFILTLGNGGTITLQVERERERVAGERDNGAPRKKTRKRPGGRKEPAERGLNVRTTRGEKLLVCPQPGCGRRFVHQAWLERHKERDH